jgi:hypothetical protein
MDEYGFDGVDLDWEYPVSPERGGREGDSANMVHLVREMKAALAGRYGLSMVLAPDYWYLRNFDPKALEEHVDFFGFMAYDLHGAWDAKNPTLGAKVRAQTDMNDIKENILPLSFADLDHKKINFGIAYYGRGYTLTDRNCKDLNCEFSGPSRKGKCTDSEGVLSRREIEEIKGLPGSESKLIPGSMVKQLTFGDDQWIGYDDDQTIALKTEEAHGYCFGGTMIWAIDYDPVKAGSGDVPEDDEADVFTIGEDLWSTASPEIIAGDEIFTLVLPPYPMSQTAVITPDPFVTSLLEQRGDVTVTITTTFIVAPFTLGDIPFHEITVYPDDPTEATFTVEPSIVPDEIIVTIPGTMAAFLPEPPFDDSYADDEDERSISYGSITPSTITTSSSSTTLVPFIFFKGSRTITIHPPPVTTKHPEPPPPPVRWKRIKNRKPWPPIKNKKKVGKRRSFKLRWWRICRIWKCKSWRIRITIHIKGLHLRLKGLKGGKKKPPPTKPRKQECDKVVIPKSTITYKVGCNPTKRAVLPLNSNATPTLDKRQACETRSSVVPQATGCDWEKTKKKDSLTWVFVMNDPGNERENDKIEGAIKKVGQQRRSFFRSQDKFLKRTNYFFGTMTVEDAQKLRRKFKNVCIPDLALNQWR